MDFYEKLSKSSYLLLCCSFCVIAYYEGMEFLVNLMLFSGFIVCIVVVIIDIVFNSNKKEDIHTYGLIYCHKHIGDTGALCSVCGATLKNHIFWYWMYGISVGECATNLKLSVTEVVGEYVKYDEEYLYPYHK